MKTIGLIGGTSWLSTIDYYKLINQLTNEKLGGSHAAEIILYSLNFQHFKDLLDESNWAAISTLFISIANKLKGAGAECIVIGANTPHLIADDVQESIPLPLIHIAAVTAEEINKQNITKVALLGTAFVMDLPFFSEKLSQYGIETMLPDIAEKEFIHQSIFNELTKGIFSDATKDRYIQVIERLIQQGAQGIIYACTEIPILLRDRTIKVKTFDTTLIHATAAVSFATKD